MVGASSRQGITTATRGARESIAAPILSQREKARSRAKLTRARVGGREHARGARFADTGDHSVHLGGGEEQPRPCAGDATGEDPARERPLARQEERTGR